MTDLLNKVTQGDCLEVMREIADKSVNLIVIDPPYNIGIKGEAWDKYKPEEYYAFMNEVFAECERVLAPNGSFYWFHNDMPQIARLMIELNRNTSFVYNSFITWDKGDWRALSWKNPSEKSNLRSWFSTAEYCLLYTFQDGTGLDRVMLDVNNFRGLRDYFDSIREYTGLYKSAIIARVGQSADHCFRSNSTQWALPTPETYECIVEEFNLRDFAGFREYESLRQEYESQRFTHNLAPNHKNVWRYKTENTGKYHACQKPLSVIDRIIKTSSNPGDIVLDCFGGSGTTAVSAVNNGRNFILIEREPEYVAIVNKRIQDAKETIA